MPFDDVIDMDEQHVQDGYADGVKAGRLKGCEEGSTLGVVEGWKIGHELGVILGTCQAWLLLAKFELLHLS